jgi:hypothetical protein
VAGVNDNGGNGIYGRGRNGIIALTNTLGGKAGVFEGDVEISGKLIVQSANLVDRVIQLEQMVAGLQQTVAQLVTVSHPPGSG